MLITSLEDMESIVSSRNDLEWDGWNVIKYTKTSDAVFSQDGVYKNGRWCNKKVFPITEEGWFLPNSLGRQHV
jgi:hypothetical protein